MNAVQFYELQESKGHHVVNAITNVHGHVGLCIVLRYKNSCDRYVVWDVTMSGETESGYYTNSLEAARKRFAERLGF